MLKPHLVEKDGILHILITKDGHSASMPLPAKLRDAEQGAIEAFLLEVVPDMVKGLVGFIADEKRRMRKKHDVQGKKRRVRTSRGTDGADVGVAPAADGQS